MSQFNNIKVIQVVGLYYPAPMYGTALVAKKIAERAYSSGLNSYVLTTDLYSYKPYKRLTVSERKLNGMKIKRTRTLTFPKLYPYFPLNTYQKLSNILYNSKGIIHAHTHLELGPTFAAFYKSLHKNNRLILQPHFHPFPGGNLGGYLLREVHEKTFSKFIIKNSDVVIVMSEIEKNAMRGLGVDECKIHRIPHGIEEIQCSDNEKGRFIKSWQIRDEDIKLICVTRISKDIINFFVTLLKEIGAGFSVILVGGLKEKSLNSIKNVIPKQLRNKFIITGFLPRNDLNAVYCIGDIFVKPTKYEAFGIAFLEAMAAGLPIVSYRVGALPELIENGVNGFLFEVGEVEKIAQKIKELDKNHKLYNKIAKNNREKAKKYLWDNILDKYIEVYEELAREVE